MKPGKRVKATLDERCPQEGLAGERVGSFGVGCWRGLSRRAHLDPGSSGRGPSRRPRECRPGAFSQDQGKAPLLNEAVNRLMHKWHAGVDFNDAGAFPIEVPVARNILRARRLVAVCPPWAFPP